MRGVAHDPVLRAKLMAQHQEGVPLSVLSEEAGIARPVLSRWWARYQREDLAGLQPRNRRPHRSPTRHPSAVRELIAHARDFGWGVQRIADEIGWVMGPCNESSNAPAAIGGPGQRDGRSRAMRRRGRASSCTWT